MNPKCPTCGTPLEWSPDLRRYLHCHKSPEATVVVRKASRARRGHADYMREYQREHSRRARGASLA